MRASLLLATLLAVAAGCGPNNGTAVLLTIDVGAGVADADLLRVNELVIDVSDAETFHKSVDLGRPLKRTERILYKSKAGGGTLRFDVAASDGTTTIAHGTTTATLVVGKTVAAEVMLGAGAFGDMGTGDGGVLTVSPPTPIIGTMRPLGFTATEPVTWAVMETGGGSIDAEGHYFSPATPGTFHVVATATADAARSATATVSVVPLKLAFIAGHLGGPGSADGVGAAARFAGPNDAKVYSNGGSFVLVADRQNHTIRQIDLGNGAVTTVAGTPGVPGNVNGTGSAARFNAPTELAVDAFNKVVFVADSGNKTIRKVALATGAVTTLPIGTATAVGGVAYDGNGHLFWSNPTDHTILQADATGMLTGSTFVGGAPNQPGEVDGSNSVSRFTAPATLAYDSTSSRVFIVESAGVRVMANASGYTVSTVSGLNSNWAGSAGFAIASSTIYGAGNNCIQSATVSGSAATSVVTLGGTCGTPGASATLFNGVHGLSVDFNGALYAADVNNDRIRKLSGGAITDVAGAPGLIGMMNGVAGATTFKAPLAIATDGTSAYIGETDSGDIRKVDLATASVTTLVPGAPAVKIPGGLVLAMGKLWAVDAGNHTLLSFDTGTGAMTVMAGVTGTIGHADGFAGNATLNAPTGLTSDGNGMLYIADTGNNLVRSYNLATTEVKTVAGTMVMGAMNGPAATATFNAPFDLVWAGGALYVADLNNNLIRKVDLAAATVSTLAGTGTAGDSDGAAGTATLRTPWRIASDGRSVFFSEGKTSSVIRRVDLATGDVSTFVGAVNKVGVQPGTLPASLNGPAGMALVPSGDMLVTDFNEGALLSIVTP